MKFINLGCGQRYSKDKNWVNVDFTSTDKEVTTCNLLKGIPFPNNHFNVVYNSHVLEHFSKNDSIFFIKECYRILKPEGIIRIAVPDLENIVKHYQKFLQLAVCGDKLAEANYDWIMLELYDQCVRNYGGGEMVKYLNQQNLTNKNFIIERIGSFSKIFWEKTAFQPRKIFKSLIKMFFPVLTVKDVLRKIKNSLPGEKYRQIGKFRCSGEIHQWMYDRFSLSRLLRQVGFKEIKVCTAKISRIPHWNNYQLDVESDGTVYKPDSLFMEALK